MSEPLPPWRQTFTVHSFDVDPQGCLAPRVLCAYLQEAAGGDATQRGAGMAELMARGLAWVLQRLLLEVEAWPEEGATVAVTTWPTRFGGAAAERDFTVEDGQGRLVARATSRWAVVDLAARRAVRLPEFLRVLAVGQLRVPLELAKLEVSCSASPPLLGECALEVRRGDLDRVGHANNTRYVEWGLEAVPEEWFLAHELAGLDITYRREAVRGDAVLSRALRAGGDRLVHGVFLAKTREPLADLTTRWRLVPVKG